MIKKPIRLRASAKDNQQVASYLKAASLGKKNQHVVPNGSNWAVRSTTSSKVTKVFSSQKEAISFAKNIAQNQETELFIHGRNGRIRERNSYGRDPFPPRG